MNRPYRRKLVLVLGLVLALMQTQFHLAFAGLGPAGLVTGDLTYHGGSVMKNPTNYLIFWQPNGISFEPPGNAFNDAKFEGLAQQYFQDVCGTSYYNTLIPRSFDPANPGNPVVSGGPILNSCTYGGSWVDTTAYPHAGTATDPLQDGDIQNAISRARTANPGWVSGTNSEYFVYTGYQIQECNSNGCTSPLAPNGPGFCAYHTFRNNVVYAFIGVGINKCYVTNNGVAPNDQTADSALDTSAHEQFEAVSDLNGDAWYNGDTAHENGDQCNFYVGTADKNADGTNFIFNAHRYRLQWEWLNGLGTDQGGGDLGATGCAPSLGSFSFGGAERPADPTATLSASANPVSIGGNPGDDIAFTFSYANTSGTDGAYSTSLQMPLEASLKYTSTSVGPAPVQSINGFGLTVLTYNLGTLGVGASGKVVVHVTPTKALPSGGSVFLGGVFTANNQLGSIAAFPPAQATVNIVNTPPSWDPISDNTVDYNDALSFKVSAFDPDGFDTLTLKSSALPAGMSFTDNGNRTGTVSGTVTAAPGTYPVTFTVNDGHNPDVTATANIVVTKEETSIAYTGDSVIAAGTNTAHLSGVLTEDGTTPLSGRQVTLSIGTAPNSNSCTGTTSATGAASCTISPVTVPLGPQPVTAGFAGDTYYLSTSNSQTVTVFGFLDRGAFVLGDVSVANATPSTALTWWGDTWYQLNSLTGGQAPSPFKGFIAAPSSAPPVCGGAWTTSAGNSATPPTTVPSYMGVAVTDKVTKSGNTISGKITKIVVVKVGPGYGPSPVSPGTGTVVATYC